MAGGSASGGKSSQRSQSQFNQSVFNEDFFKNAMQGIGNLFNSQGDNQQRQVEGGQEFSRGAMDQMQGNLGNQMQGGAYKDMGLQKQFNQSMSQSQNNPSNAQSINNMIMGGQGNNYADAMKSQYVQDANDATDNMMSNLDARAAGSGMSGSSRQGVAQAIGMRDINRNLQRNMAQTGYNTFEKDLDRKLGIANQADQNTAQRQQLLGNMIGQQQGAMNNAYGQAGNMIGYGQGQQMIPYQQYGLMGDPTILNQGDSSSYSKSKEFSVAGKFGV